MQRERRSDNDLLRFRERIWGFSGIRFPFPVPTRGILPAAAAGFLTLAGLSAAGVDAWRYLIAVAVAAAVTWLADRYTGPDRPVSILPGLFVNETGAPRPRPAREIRFTMRPGAIPVYDDPPGRKDRRERLR